MRLTLTILMHNGCNHTAIHLFNVKSRVAHNLCQKTSVLMPSNVQIHKVPLNDAKISFETKTAFL